MSKRWLAMVLSCAMLLGCLGGLSLFVSADESTGEVYYYDFTKKNGEEYASNGLVHSNFKDTTGEGHDGYGEFTSLGFKANNEHCYFQVTDATLKMASNVGFKAYFVDQNKSDALINYDSQEHDYANVVNGGIQNGLMYGVVSNARFAGDENGSSDFRLRMIQGMTVRRVEAYELNAATLTAQVSETAVAALLATKMDTNAADYTTLAKTIREGLASATTPDQTQINTWFSELWAAEQKLVNKVTYVALGGPQYTGNTMDGGAIPLVMETSPEKRDVYFFYNNGDIMRNLFNITDEDAIVDTAVTLDYQWEDNGNADSTNARIATNPSAAEGNLRDVLNFVPNERSVRTFVHENQKIDGDVLAMQISCNGNQKFTIYGISFRVTKADGSVVIAQRGTAPEETSEVKLSAPNTDNNATVETVDELGGTKCIKMPQGANVQYAGTLLANALGVTADEDVRLDVTLDYYWKTTDTQIAQNRWGRFRTVEETGKETYDGGYGFFDLSWGMETFNKWATTTVSRSHQKLGSGTAWYFDTTALRADDVLYIKGIRIAATKADGTVTTVAWGTTSEAMDVTPVGYTAELQSDICMKFRVKIGDSAATKVQVYVNDDITRNAMPIDQIEHDNDGTYVIPVFIPAKNMCDKISVRVIAEGREYVINYSIKEYAEHLVLAEDKASALVKAMLNYGSMAQVYFNPSTGENSLANVNLPADDKKIDSVDKTTLSSYNSYNKKQSENGITLKAANLSLLSKTTLRLFFDIGEKEASTLTFLRDGQQLTGGWDDKQYYVEIDLAPNELAKKVAVTVAEGDATLMTATYNVMAYGYNVLRADANTYGALQNVIRALYLYNQQATTYAG